MVLKSKYDIQECLSEDLLSFCYKAKVIGEHRYVLIWQYKPEYLFSGLNRRLIKLAEKVIMLKDSALLAMLDYFYDGKSFYTIHEYVAGMEPMEVFLKKKNGWEPKLLWQLSTQLLSVLLRVESRKLVCGCVNLNHLYVTPEGYLKVAKVAIQIEILKSNLSKFDLLEDCIFYPPEFLQRRLFTNQSDMYSFGMLMYLFFSKKWPYKFSLKKDDIKREILKGAKPFKGSFSHIPERLSDVIEVCLHLNPYSRFSSFVSLVKSYKGKMEVFCDVSKSNMEKELEASLLVSSRRLVMYSIKVVTGAFLTLFLFVMIYWGYMTYLTSIPEIVVPQVVGLTYTDAQYQFNVKGLSSKVAGYRAHAGYSKGTVVETKPPGGRAVKSNRLIRVFLSNGVGPVLVPDLIGRSKQQVQRLLIERALDVDIVSEKFSLEYDEGVVVSQNPMPNSFIGPSKNIQIVISKGFPVSVQISKAKQNFFYNKDDLRYVYMTLNVLDDWVSQEVTIYFIQHNQREKIFSQTIESGAVQMLEYELEKGGVLEVYFNDDLAYMTVIDMQDSPTDNVRLSD